MIIDNSGNVDYYTADIISTTDYYPFGMPMPERNYARADYRFGFNGKENINEVEGNGNWQDYGERMYSTRLGRFPSPDPIITKDHKYPELSTYQFASNTPIQATDLDGLEAVYQSDGTKIKQIGGNTQVYVVTDNYVSNFANITNKDLLSNSKNIGMKEDELNTRAFLYTIRTTEGHGNTLPYDIQYGGTKFKGKDYDGNGEISIEEKYKDHPREAKTKWGRTSTAAGAYEILEGTFDQKKGKAGGTDFSPKSQDKIAVQLIKSRGALDDVKAGKTETSFKLLRNEWSSLPGAKEQGMKLNDANKTFKRGVSLELQQKSQIKTPQGELFK